MAEQVKGARRSHFALGTKLCLIVLFLGVAGLSSMSFAQENQSPVVLVQEVSKHSIRPSFQHPARLQAVRTASVRPIVSALITELNIVAGDQVEKGDFLVGLDQTDFEIALAEAKANLTQAEANSVKAQADYERAQQLVERNVTSRRELDFALASRDVALAQVDIAIARLDKSKRNLEFTKVYAPFSGRISAPNFAIGDLFVPGDPTQAANIAEIVSIDPIYAIALVDQVNYFNFLARRLQLAQAGKSIPPLEMELILPGGDIYPLKGVFENWNNTAVSSTGTIAARVLFDNPGGVLLPGENVTIKGSVISPIEAVLVPQRAVSFDQQGHFIWVVRDDGTVERRNIDIGIRSGANWSVSAGLQEGETIIVEGLQKVRAGLQVTPKPFQG